MSTIYTDPVIDWDPSMTATSMWYDPAARSTLSLSGTNILSMLDKSGNGRNLPQDPFGKFPAYVANSLNGLPGIDYNPGKRLFNNSLSTATVRFVISIIKSAGGSTWNNYHAVLDRGSNGSRMGGILQAGQSGFHGNVFPSAAWQNGTSVTVSSTCFTNISSPFIIAYSTSATSMTSVSMGNADASDGGGAGTQYETIALPVVPSQALREQLEGYLAHKWGLTASLSASHPYKNFRPTA